MALVLNTNISSMFNVNALNKSKMALDTSLQRLSSGSRINSARDDATGLANGIQIDSQLRGAQQAQRNANDAIAAAQTQDGYMAQITENLQRMRELAVQAGGTATGDEVKALGTENTRLLGLMGSGGGAVVASSSGATRTNLGVKPTLGAAYTVTALGSDLTNIGNARAKYGADMSSLQSASNALGTESVNLASQLSTVMDTDYAEESANMTKNNILQQAGTAALSQANQAPNNITQLLR